MGGSDLEGMLVAAAGTVIVCGFTASARAVMGKGHLWQEMLWVLTSRGLGPGH